MTAVPTEPVLRQAQTPFQGLLLAAGRGTRFDAEGRDNKLLATLPGTSRCVVEAAAMNLLVVVPVLAVVPSLQSELAQRLADLGCELVACGIETQDMSASLMCGVRQTIDAAGWVVALGDMPFVQPATHAALLSALQVGVAIAAPSYQGKRGNPVAFSAAHYCNCKAIRARAVCYSVTRCIRCWWKTRVSIVILIREPIFQPVRN